MALIIYHSKDLDGICSGAILHKRFPGARLFGYDYNEPFIVEEAFSEGEMVIMADVSMPMGIMEKIAERSCEFYWIDHHVSSHNDFRAFFQDHHSHEDGGFSACEGKLKYVYENGRAACELCWEFSSDDDMPEAVLLLGEYDTWRNKDKERWNNVILPFQYGMRLDGFSPKTLAKYLDSPSNQEKVVIGRSIIKYQSEQNRFTTSRYAFEARVNIEGRNLKAICCNGVPSNSMSFEHVWDEEKYDVMVPIGFDGKKWGFSFYTTKEGVDCSEIARSFGGGGHKKAAGCSSDDIRKVLVW